MDSRHGLDYIVENAEYTTKLGAGTYIIFNHFGHQLQFRLEYLNIAIIKVLKIIQLLRFNKIIMF